MLPAYAGMIPGAPAPAAAEVSAPRVCGDDPTPNCIDEHLRACSPRMRG